jgi:hypothetical protein
MSSGSSVALTQICLVHLGGERKFVEILRAHKPLKLEVRWGLAGIYVLDLQKNQLRDSRLARGGQSSWRALDLEMAKKVYWDMIVPKAPAIPNKPSLVKVTEMRSLAMRRVLNCDCWQTKNKCSTCEAIKEAL